MAGCYFGLFNKFSSFVDRYAVITTGSPIFIHFKNVNLVILAIQINHLILLLVTFLIVIGTVESVSLQTEYVKYEQQKENYQNEQEQQRILFEQNQQQEEEILQQHQQLQNIKSSYSNWGIFGNPPKSFISGYNIEQSEHNDIFSKNRHNSKSLAMISTEQKNYWQLQQNLQQQHNQQQTNKYKEEQNFNLQITPQQKGYENVQSRTNRDLLNVCKKNSDCRSIAYFCSTKGLCECNEGYFASGDNLYCLGTIGKKCLYDNHCINGAYCKGQKICTCKLEFPYLSWDKRSCEENGSKAIKVPLLPSSTSSSILSAFLVFRFLHSVQLYAHF